MAVENTSYSCAAQTATSTRAANGTMLSGTVLKSRTWSPGGCLDSRRSYHVEGNFFSPRRYDCVPDCVMRRGEAVSSTRRRAPVHEVRRSPCRVLVCQWQSMQLHCLLSVRQFPGTFEGRPVLFRVTSVAGHVFETCFPAEYQSWDSVDPVELFRVPVAKVERKGSMAKHIEEEARGVDVLILWLDCDRVRVVSTTL